MVLIDLYSKLNVMPSLVDHMLRVADVVMTITSDMQMPLDQRDILLKASLVHDVGNIVKFDLSLYPEFTKEKGVEYWEHIKNEVIKKYGDNAHLATIKMLEECNIQKEVIDLVGLVSFRNANKVFLEGNLNAMILIYADQRVSPFGVMTLEDRLKDGSNRYLKNHKTLRTDNDQELFNINSNALKEIEKLLVQKGMSMDNVANIGDRVIRDYYELVL